MIRRPLHISVFSFCFGSTTFLTHMLNSKKFWYLRDSFNRNQYLSNWIYCTVPVLLKSLDLKLFTGSLPSTVSLPPLRCHKSLIPIVFFLCWLTLTFILSRYFRASSNEHGGNLECALNRCTVGRTLQFLKMLRVSSPSSLSPLEFQLHRCTM